MDNILDLLNIESGSIDPIVQAHAPIAQDSHTNSTLIPMSDKKKLMIEFIKRLEVTL